MSLNVDRDMGGEAFRFLGGVPRPTKQPADVSSHHRCRLIERKEGIKASSLELPLGDGMPGDPETSRSSSQACVCKEKLS